MEYQLIRNIEKLHTCLFLTNICVTKDSYLCWVVLCWLNKTDIMQHSDCVLQKHHSEVEKVSRSIKDASAECPSEMFKVVLLNSPQGPIPTWMSHTYEKLSFLRRKQIESIQINQRIKMEIYVSINRRKNYMGI